MINKQIHLIWVDWYGKEYPERYQSAVQTLTNLNPEYQIRIWNYATLDSFIKSHYKLYYDFYRQLTNLKLRHHLARFALVAEYGGFYFDFDQIYLKPLDSLAKDHDLILVNKNNRISCSMFGAKAKHPFIVGWLKQMYHNVDPNQVQTKEKIDLTIGCSAFNKYYLQSNQIAKIVKAESRELGGHWVDPSPTDNVDQTTVYVVFISLIIIVLLFIFTLLK